MLAANAAAAIAQVDVETGRSGRGAQAAVRPCSQSRTDLVAPGYQARRAPGEPLNSRARRLRLGLIFLSEKLHALRRRACLGKGGWDRPAARVCEVDRAAGEHGLSSPTGLSVRE